MSLLLGSDHETPWYSIIPQITVIECNTGFRDHKHNKRKQFLTGWGTGYFIVELMGSSHISKHALLESMMSPKLSLLFLQGGMQDCLLSPALLNLS